MDRELGWISRLYRKCCSSSTKDADAGDGTAMETEDGYMPTKTAAEIAAAAREMQIDHMHFAASDSSLYKSFQTQGSCFHHVVFKEAKGVKAKARRGAAKQAPKDLAMETLSSANNQASVVACGAGVACDVMSVSNLTSNPLHASPADAEAEATPFNFGAQKPEASLFESLFGAASNHRDSSKSEKKSVSKDSSKTMSKILDRFADEPAASL